MKSEKIDLSDNHKRSLSSTLTIVERLLIELEDLMVHSDSSCCFEITRDVDEDVLIQNIPVIREALEHICLLKEKYNTDKTVQSLERVIDAKRTKIWEILHNSKSRRMKGFGEFPPEHIKEYDDDLDGLMEIANRIRF